MCVGGGVLAGGYNIFPSQNRIMLSMLLWSLILFNYKCIIFSYQYAVECSFVHSLTYLIIKRKHSFRCHSFDISRRDRTNAPNHSGPKGKLLSECLAAGGLVPEG